MASKVYMAAALLALTSTSALAQEFTLKISSPTINDVTHVWMQEFERAVEERSEGRINVELYPANQLGQIPATVEGTMMGTIEMTIPAVGFFAGFEPRFQVLDVPGLFDSIEHGQRVLNDPEVIAALSELGNDAGVEPLFVYLNGPLMVLSREAIETVADFQGQRLRLPGAAPVQTIPYQALQASGQSMPLGELLPAMQNRAVEGGIAAFAIFDGFQFYDVAKDITYLPKSYLMAGALVNSEFMDSLGPDLEAIVREEAARTQELFSTYGVEVVQELEANWEANGGNIIHLSDEDQAEFLSIVEEGVLSYIDSEPSLKALYDILVAAADRHR